MKVRSEITVNSLLKESKAQHVLLLGVICCHCLAHKAKANQVGSFGQALVYCVYDFTAPNLQLKYQK